MSDAEIINRVGTFVEWLQSLSYDEAEDALLTLHSAICLDCGGPPKCQCMNDD